QDEFKIVDYENSFKIHSNECDRDVSLHDMNGKLTLYIDAYTQNIPAIAYILDLFHEYFHFSRLHSSQILGEDYYELIERNVLLDYLKEKEPKIDPRFDYVLNASKNTLEEYKKFKIELIDQDIEFINDRMAECFHNADCRLTEDARAEHLAFYVSVKKHLKTLRRQYQMMIEAVNWEDE
uniref:hypothetical protein n=1 Tax=Fibrobacter sp. TaxID=35828 RepID=UPI003870AA01